MKIALIVSEEGWLAQAKNTTTNGVAVAIVMNIGLSENPHRPS